MYLEEDDADDAPFVLRFRDYNGTIGDLPDIAEEEEEDDEDAEEEIEDIPTRTDDDDEEEDIDEYFFVE